MMLKAASRLGNENVFVFDSFVRFFLLLLHAFYLFFLVPVEKTNETFFLLNQVSFWFISIFVWGWSEWGGGLNLTVAKASKHN